MTETAPPAPPAGAILRLELFVDDLAASIAFYVGARGFYEERRDDEYASLRNGTAVLGLGLARRLSASHHFGREALARQKGVGVEIVPEVADVDAAYRAAAASPYAVEGALRDRPWGLGDFRIVGPRRVLPEGHVAAGLSASGRPG
jgi:catechol 2,3-dioxygenase-like lactoylglutathione lyase family enzyme